MDNLRKVHLTLQKEHCCTACQMVFKHRTLKGVTHCLTGLLSLMIAKRDEGVYLCADHVKQLMRDMGTE